MFVILLWLSAHIVCETFFVLKECRENHGYAKLPGLVSVGDNTEIM
jgi:hypothetical protein